MKHTLKTTRVGPSKVNECEAGDVILLRHPVDCWSGPLLVGPYHASGCTRIVTRLSDGNQRWVDVDVALERVISGTFVEDGAA